MLSGVCSGTFRGSRDRGRETQVGELDAGETGPQDQHRVCQRGADAEENRNSTVVGCSRDCVQQQEQQRHQDHGRDHRDAVQEELARMWTVTTPRLSEKELPYGDEDDKSGDEPRETQRQGAAEPAVHGMGHAASVAARL